MQLGLYGASVDTSQVGWVIWNDQVYYNISGKVRLHTGTHLTVGGQPRARFERQLLCALQRYAALNHHFIDCTTHSRTVWLRQDDWLLAGSLCPGLPLLARHLTILLVVQPPPAVLCAALLLHHLQDWYACLMGMSSLTCRSFARRSEPHFAIPGELLHLPL